MRINGLLYCGNGAGEEMRTDNYSAAMQSLLADVIRFTAHASGLILRRYQQEVARAVTASVLEGRGLSFVVMFPRQSGKNELQAQIQVYLLARLMTSGAEIVQVSPTWKPQALNAMRRLERVLRRNLLVKSLWRKEHGYIYRLETAQITFLSGHKEANIVGATASALLSIDEAQDILIEKYDKEIAPMAASTNATVVFWGTAWTGDTLLARERRAAEKAELADGFRRVFVLDADEVTAEVPAYGRFVARQVRKLGRNHPLVRTQFFSEEIDGQGGLFPEERRRLMQGTHPPLRAPRKGFPYALLLDVAGEDEAAGDDPAPASLANPGRDSTALTVVEVDLKTLADPLIQAPSYRVVSREEWVGVRHSTLYSRLVGMAEHWRARYVVVDATGVGAGLASFLEKALPGRIIPFVFTAASKSALGWDFLAVVETGRYREYDPLAEKGEAFGVLADLQVRFWQQVRACRHQVTEGAGKRLRWSVPEGARDTRHGALIHDDLLLSAALCSVLDKLEWQTGGAATLIRRGDPLLEIDKGGF